MPPTRRDSAAFTIVVSVLVGVCAAFMGVVLMLAGAPGVTLLATALAVIPVIALLACYLWLDRYEPEPKRLLAAALFWGALVATAAAIVLGGIGGLLGGISRDQGLTVVAPITEEATKGLFLVLLLWWRRGELDGLLDGIVYAGMVGIGFAFTENILYLAAAYNGTDGMGPGGVEGITATFVLRCLISPFAHPLFTTFVGIGVGVAVSTSRHWLRFAAPAAGYLCAVAAHALWNTSTLHGGSGFIRVYVVLMLPALVALIALAVWARTAERQMLAAALTDAARRGLLPASDIEWVVDLGARRAARRYAAGLPSPDAVALMTQYQQAAVELGFLHSRLLRGTPPPDWQTRGRQYLARIDAIRPSIAFPGQVVPVR